MTQASHHGLFDEKLFMRQHQITQKGEACENKIVPDQTVHLGAVRQRSLLYSAKCLLIRDAQWLSGRVLNFRSLGR